MLLCACIRFLRGRRRQGSCSLTLKGVRVIRHTTHVKRHGALYSRCAACAMVATTVTAVVGRILYCRGGGKKAVE